LGRGGGDAILDLTKQKDIDWNDDEETPSVEATGQNQGDNTS